MNVSKVFLGSSIHEMKDEREKIGALVQQINNILIDQMTNTIIDLFRCEYLSKMLEHRPTQDIIDDEIKHADLCIFMVYQTLGTYTKKEFELALSHYQQYKQPHIVVIFKTIDDAINPNLIDFYNNLLQQQIEHHYFNNSQLLKRIVLKVLDEHLIPLDLMTRNQDVMIKSKKIQL